MKLANYISDLLYRYECVIIPGFGGFVTNQKSAIIDADKQTLNPPYKQISFNKHLQNNDGLLANYIACVDKIKYNCALNFIKFEIESWEKKLAQDELVLDAIGSFRLENNHLHFEPQKGLNYLTSSFGLGTVVAPEVKRETYQKEVEKIEDKAPVYLSPEKRNKPHYLKYAAIFVLGLSTIALGGKLVRDYIQQNTIAEAHDLQNKAQQKIERATFVISDPLPTLNLNVTGQKKTFHVIAGAFRFPENAEKKMSQLKHEGYPSQILGVNKWNLTVVSYGSYANKEEARAVLDNIKSNVAKDAWLLTQEF